MATRPRASTSPVVTAHAAPRWPMVPATRVAVRVATRATTARLTLVSTRWHVLGYHVIYIRAEVRGRGYVELVRPCALRVHAGEEEEIKPKGSRTLVCWLCSAV